MNTALLEPHFARVGVDPLTAAFDHRAAPAAPRHSRAGAISIPAPTPAPAPPPVAPASVERIAALKAAMPAQALRVFESWQAAPENSPARAAIEAALPAHALRALATLAAAVRESRAAVSSPAAPPIHTWADLVSSGSSPVPARPLALYAHFPFCAARCAFCPFYRYSDPSDWRPYRDALLREIELAASPFAPPPSPDAIYFGGGTPSDLPGEALAVLVSSLCERFGARPDTEITVEGRPSTLDPEKIALLRAAGVNRFSLGVQTFDGAVRQAMGRKLGDAGLLPRLRAIGAAAGDAPVIIDLIYGLPGQTDESWESDLGHVLREEAIAGLDLYRLKVFPGSPLARLASEGRSEPADDATMARRFALGVEKFEAAGFRRLSRWHWARDGRERSVYNRLAKGAGDIVPLGCGAGGRWLGRDFINTPSLPAWFENVRSGRKPCAGLGAPNPPWRETLSAQIEACRLEPLAWNGASPSDRGAALRLLGQWTAAGLLAPEGIAWRMTLAGHYWSDRLLHSLQTILGASAAETVRE